MNELAKAMKFVLSATHGVGEETWKGLPVKYFDFEQVCDQLCRDITLPSGISDEAKRIISASMPSSKEKKNVCVAEKPSESNPNPVKQCKLPNRGSDAIQKDYANRMRGIFQNVSQMCDDPSTTTGAAWCYTLSKSTKEDRMLRTRQIKTTFPAVCMHHYADDTFSHEIGDGQRFKVQLQQALGLEIDDTKYASEYEWAKRIQMDNPINAPSFLMGNTFLKPGVAQDPNSSVIRIAPFCRYYPQYGGKIGPNPDDDYCAKVGTVQNQPTLRSIQTTWRDMGCPYIVELGAWDQLPRNKTNATDFGQFLSNVKSNVGMESLTSPDERHIFSLYPDADEVANKQIQISFPIMKNKLGKAILKAINDERSQFAQLLQQQQLQQRQLEQQQRQQIPTIAIPQGMMPQQIQLPQYQQYPQIQSPQVQYGQQPQYPQYGQQPYY